LEASALQHNARLPALAGRSPLLRLQSDERLIALIRRGHHGAFEALVQRYQPRLLAFCRHMLGSQEDAEDVLQEVFAASFNAICADDRPINARPWLYRIARNRCLNHLRRAQPTGQDSMDIFEGDGGITTADTVHKREEFRQIVSDVGELPETQRTALLLREIDALSYDQIAEAMDTTIPSVKSLLVRARVSLAEASEARLLTCDEVRLELGQVAEGLVKTTAPVRRHLKSCERCSTFRVELRKTNKALAAIYAAGPLLFLKKLGVAKLGLGAGGAAAGATGGAAAGGAGVAATAGGAGMAATAGATAAAAGSFTASGALSAGISTIATKAAAGMAAAVIVTAGAVEVRHAATTPVPQQPAVAFAPPAAAAAPAPAAPVHRTPARPAARPERKIEKPKPAEPAPPVQATPAPASEPAPVATAPATPTPPPVQEGESTVTLPDQPVTTTPTTTTPAPGEPTVPTTPPGEGTTTPVTPPPAPPAGEPPVTTTPSSGWGAPPPAPAQ
jgi:RNA polymerase sigma factor (sigma-70 family)